ncbi:hypothetical protein L873DRAFT_1420464 [Choiromyces venosus 120613-1]|uniref:Uncharacterized protein n=1 Tax=Choiromyces venosus 120613-1 TaxID=1336337 RepID=A0A3N4J856_9PEZI|nr:hypothetical protein L873DRAFT_1420464 [Choiromyces venosus 120613-1]
MIHYPTPHGTTHPSNSPKYGIRCTPSALAKNSRHAKDLGNCRPCDHFPSPSPSSFVQKECHPLKKQFSYRQRVQSQENNSVDNTFDRLTKGSCVFTSYILPYRFTVRWYHTNGHCTGVQYSSRGRVGLGPVCGLLFDISYPLIFPIWEIPSTSYFTGYSNRCFLSVGQQQPPQGNNRLLANGLFLCQLGLPYQAHYTLDGHDKFLYHYSPSYKGR